MHASSARPHEAAPAPTPPTNPGNVGAVVSGGGGQRVRVRAVVWGIHRDAETTALEHVRSGQWIGAHRYEVVGADFVIGGAPCPLDVKHESVLAHRSTYGWAWIVRTADNPSPAPTVAPGTVAAHGRLAETGPEL